MKKINLNSNNYPSKLHFPPKSKKIVFISGVFNVLHPGHLRLIDFASNLGDFLVVGVLGDKLVSQNNNSEDERVSIILELKKVNVALILNENPEIYLTKLRPNIVVKGKEHEKKYNSD